MEPTANLSATSMELAPMHICILYGGRSGEHEVSLKSAASVVKNLDLSKYQVTAIGIDKAGLWHLQQTIILNP